MKKETQTLLFWFAFFFIAKAILTYFIPSPSIFGDEYLYTKLARNLFEYGTYTVHGFPSIHYPPLYPSILSISFLFKDMVFVYSFMKLINSFLSSLIIFPAFYIARDFLSRKKSLFISIFVSLLALSFNFSSYILSENLFYPLALTTIYFMYKAFKENKNIYFILSGILLGSSFLTRFSGIALVPLMFYLFIFLRKKFDIKFNKILSHYLASLIVVSPWFIRNFLTFGVSVSSFIGRSQSLGGLRGEIPLKVIALTYLDIIPTYFGYALLSSLIFFGIYYMYGYKIKDINFKALYILSLGLIINSSVLAARQAVARVSFYQGTNLYDIIHLVRPIGRYMDTTLPLIIILGFIVYQKYIIDEKLFRRITIFSTLLILISSQIFLYSLFPVNNQSLSFLGVFQYGLQFILLNKTTIAPIFNLTTFLILLAIIVIFLIIIYLFRNKEKLKYFLLIFIILNTLLSFGITYWNSNANWSDGPQMQIGLSYNGVEDKNLREIILFDERFEGKNTKSDQSNLYERSPNNSTTTMSGFFMNDEIRIGNINNLSGVNYVVTKEKTNLNLIKEVDGIYLYKVEE